MGCCKVIICGADEQRMVASGTNDGQARMSGTVLGQAWGDRSKGLVLCVSLTGR